MSSSDTFSLRVENSLYEITASGMVFITILSFTDKDLRFSIRIFKHLRCKLHYY